MIATFAAMWVVFRKELRDGLRDRRALLSALLYPLLGPLLAALLLGSVAERQAEAPALPIPIANQDQAPELVHWLERHGNEVVEAPADPREAVRHAQVPVVVSVPPDYADKLAEGKPARIELIVDGSRNDARPAVSRVEGLLEYYGKDLASKRLLARGVSPELAHPVVVAQVEVASEQEIAANGLAFVPMFVLLASFVGGMQVAVDVSAGERERGSLESLLLNPVPRRALVVGKWLAALVFALACVALTLLTCVLVLRYSSVKTLGLELDLRPSTLLGVFAAVVPMALMAAALQLLVASFARSFKEAQTYISLLIFLPMMPAIVGMMTGIEPSSATLLIPGVGQQLVVESLFGGAGAGPMDFLLPSLSALAVTGLCLGATTWLFRRESIVFGD